MTWRLFASIATDDCGSQEWAYRIIPSTIDEHVGHACDAARQSRMYRQLADDGRDAFQHMKVVDEHDDE
jgi:hypothetical protein